MAGNGHRRARLRNLVDEIVPRDVVARIEPVEVAMHSGQFLLAIGRERLLGLVDRPASTLPGEHLREAGIVGQTRRLCLHLRHEALAAAADHPVGKPEPDRFAGSHRQAGRRDAARVLRAAMAGQQIGPQLRAVEVAHVLVVRIEDYARAQPDLVGGSGEEDTAGTGVAAQGRDGEVA